mgnify:CR=1 FL=1|tara:strand:+ start:2537 stop:3304 length:768 start_codon:yes stop_codon:yes gene_type:complete
MANRSLGDFYSKFTAGGRTKSDSGGMMRDGKYMFSIAPNNFFHVTFDLVSWQQMKLPVWARNESNLVNSTYIDNLGYLVQSVSIPGVGTEGASEEITGDFGKVLIPPKGDVINTDNTLSIDFLNTEYSVFEYMLLPWLEETQSNVWIPEYVFNEAPYGVPFARANIAIHFYDQKNKNVIHTYTFMDAYPIGFTTLDLEQSANDDLTRSASFNFDYMTVTFGKPKDDTPVDLDSIRDARTNTSGSSLFSASLQLPS